MGIEIMNDNNTIYIILLDLGRIEGAIPRYAYYGTSVTWTMVSSTLVRSGIHYHSTAPANGKKNINQENL